jgi:predicted CoA-binding protein
MPSDDVTLEAVQAFLAQKRSAVVGASRDARTAASPFLNEPCRGAYDRIPGKPRTQPARVNTAACFPRLQEIQPPVTAAGSFHDLPEVPESVVSDCVAAGIRQLSMYWCGWKGARSARKQSHSAAHTGSR